MIKVVKAVRNAPQPHKVFYLVVYFRIFNFVKHNAEKQQTNKFLIKSFCNFFNSKFLKFETLIKLHHNTPHHEYSNDTQQRQRRPPNNKRNDFII